LRLTRIGEITAEKKIVFDSGGKLQKLESGAWDPFREH